jgi:isopenicillin N synthase-like dioxygenase
MHYPPVAASASASGSPAFRISPHTDWGTLTLLFQSGVGGLEVRPPKYTSPTPSLDTETWTPAPALPHKILVNIGDMLEFWTAGRLKSTWHRVVPTATEGGLDRYTFAYFLHPDRESVLVPMRELELSGWTPRYAGVGRTAEEHIHARIRMAHGGKAGDGEGEKKGGVRGEEITPLVEAQA